jgi:iron complex outermembrane receptor protein
MSRVHALRGVSAAAIGLAISTPTGVASAQDAPQVLPPVTVDAPNPKPAAIKRGPASNTAARGKRRNDTAAARPPQNQQPTPPPPGTSQSGAGLGGRETGYNVSGSVLATKDAIPILQNPLSVKVIPRQVLDDQQAISIQDAVIGNVSNVQPAGDAFYDGFTIRGFDSLNHSTYRNNLRALLNSQIETANLQSIEVLKGPAAMFFGRLEPGGAINLVTKQPLDNPYYSLQEQIDSWGRGRTSIDATGPATDDKTWLYRIDAAFTKGGSFRDFVTTENEFVAPALTYRPNSDFQFNLRTEYQHNQFVADADTVIPVVGNRPAPIPISRYLQNPAITVDHPSTQTRGLVAFDWTYEFAPTWSVTNRFSYENAAYSQRVTDIVALNESTGIADRVLDDTNLSRVAIATNLDIKGKVGTGPFTHTLLFGVDYQDFKGATDGLEDFVADRTAGSINIFTGVNQPNPLGVTPTPGFFFTQTENWTGAYAQDKISFLGDHVHLLVGGRYDWAQRGVGSSTISLAEANGPFDPNADGGNGAGFLTGKDQAFSPRAGVVIQPWRWFSLYASYSKSFGLTNAVVLPGTPPFPPQVGTQWEGGMKAELLDGRLTFTSAYFDIVKTNIVQKVPGTQFGVPVGEVESKGFEVEAEGRLDSHWSLLANYGYDDARITKDVNEQGNRLQNAPLHSGGIWLKYDADGAYRGLSLGAGVTAVGERQGDNQNDFQLPAYARVDLMAQYRISPSMVPWSAWKAATVQLNVKNLFNDIYYLNSFDRFSIVPGAPRTYLLSLRGEF